MSDLIHPVTGLRALGMGKRGPIWPVLGGSEDAPPVVDPVDPPVDPPVVGDKGFPAGVPVADMTIEQQAAYHKYHGRKHENTVKAYGGVTPKQVTEMQDRIKALETERLSESEKAVEAAKDEASANARAAAEAEWRPKYQATQLEAIAGRILEEEQLASFMAIVSPEKFVGKDGEIDREAVMGHLTAIYGQTKREFGSGLPQHVNWGQNGSKPPAPSGAALGKAEIAKRFPNKTT